MFGHTFSGLFLGLVSACSILMYRQNYSSANRIDVPRFFKSMERALQGVQHHMALGSLLPILPGDRQ